MGKLSIWSICTIIFIAISSPLWGQDLNIDLDHDYEETAQEEGQQSTEQEQRTFMWAWEIPDDFYRQYPITNYSYWNQVRAPIGGGMRAAHYRDNDDTDEFQLAGYFFFRPLVINLSDSYISAGAFLSFAAFWSEENINLNILNPKAIVRKRGIPVSTGLSLMWSMPNQGIQMTFEVGNIWIRTRYRFNEIVVSPLPGVGTARIRRVQTEESVNIFYRLDFLSERQFFNGITLETFHTIRYTTPIVTAKTTHTPFGTIEAPKGSALRRPVRTNFSAGTVFIKLISIPIAEVPALGVSKYNVFSLEPFGTIGHFANEDGHFLGAGVRARVFGALGFYYAQAWEQQNDAPDSMVFAVELGFQLGRSSISPNRVQ